MVGYVIILRVLASRVVRRGIIAAAGLTVRTIWGVLRSPITVGAIRGMWAGAMRLGGFLVKRVGALNLVGLGLTFSTFWGDIVSTVQFLWNFNWNTTDEALDASIKTAATALAGTLGATLGNALGYLVCGAVPGTIVATVNEPLALYIFEELEDEALDEIAGNLAVLINQSTALAARAAFTFAFKNIRNLVRESSTAFRARLIAGGVTSEEQLNKAVADRNKPWSFALSTNEFLEKTIPNEIVRTGVEELLEEFGDACVESGFIIAGRLDSYLASARAAAGSILGPERTVEILFNRPPGGPTPPSGTP